MSRLGSSWSGHPVVEHRVGLAAQHLDVVAQVDQGLGQVPGVDALAAHVGLAPVGQVGDAQRLVASLTAGPGVGRDGAIGRLHKGVSLLFSDPSVKCTSRLFTRL